MSTLLGVLVLIALLVPLSISIRRSTELFVVRIGPSTEVGQAPSHVHFIRGRIPRALLRELRDVLEPSEARGTLRVIVERGQAVLAPRGNFDEATLQRVRNLVAMYPVAKLKAGVPPSGNARASTD